jgi:putative NADH-flavin reductase
VINSGFVKEKCWKLEPTAIMNEQHQQQKEKNKNTSRAQTEQAVNILKLDVIGSPTVDAQISGNDAIMNSNSGYLRTRWG